MRRRREFPVRMTQAMQVVVQNNIISVALKPGDRPLKAPLFLRVINAVPWLQGITARFRRARRAARACALAGSRATVARQAFLAPHPITENPPSTGIAVPVTKSDALE